MSYYYKLAHKSLHDHSPVSITDLIVDVELFYLRDDGSGNGIFTFLNYPSGQWSYIMSGGTFIA